jgi:tRNA(fMet)-specific endonuclease VapC
VKIALDTNAYRALHEGSEILADQIAEAVAVALPVVVVGELRFGFSLGSKFAENERTLERFLALAAVRVLPVTLETTPLFGEIAAHMRRGGFALSQNDLWLAAMCKQHGFALATRDRDFDAVMGLVVVRF